MNEEGWVRIIATGGKMFDLDNYFKYMSLDQARWHRAKMLHYRGQKKLFVKNSRGYKAASKLEQKHAVMFWEMMNYYKEIA